MTRACDQCGVDYEAKRPSSRYCSARCRNRSARAKGGKPRQPAAQPEATTPDSAIAEHVARELSNQVDTAAGQMAIALARRLDANLDTGSAMAAVARELRTLIVEVLGNQPQAADPIDELRARRDRRPA